MIDITLLRVMSSRKDFDKLYQVIGEGVLEERARVIAKGYEKYFSTFDHTAIDWTVFIPRFRAWNPGLTEEDMSVYTAVLRQAMKPVDDTTRAGIANDLHELNLATTLANMTEQFNLGNLPDLQRHVEQAVDAYRNALDIKGLHWVDDPIDQLLEQAADDSGIRWRLNEINEKMRGLRPGDFGIVSARSDAGKTTLLASEVTHMAPQVDGNVVWLNNEGPGSRIKIRLYQAALNATIVDLKDTSRKDLNSQYAAAVGRADKIRVFDVHGFNTAQIDQILTRNDPAIVVYDMIDNIRGFGNMPRTDLILEEMYKWARELSVHHECVGFATSQASVDADGLQYPLQHMLKDSKTGKQGAADFIMFAGMSNDLMLKNSRFIGTPKNKLRRVGVSGNPGEVLIDVDRARYRSVDEVDEGELDEIE